MFHDGMKNIPRLQLFGKNEVDKLQGNRRMDMVFHEVTEASDPMPGIDERELLFGDPILDWNDHFVVKPTDVPNRKSNSGKAQQATKASTLFEQESRKGAMSDLIKEVNKANPKERKQGLPNRPRKSDSSKRIPMGWSFRVCVPKRGDKPKCKGCKRVINCEDDCVRFQHHEKETHLFPVIDQFHCRCSCLMKMKREHLEKFLEKHWTENVVCEAVNAIRKEWLAMQKLKQKERV